MGLLRSSRMFNLDYLLNLKVDSMYNFQTSPATIPSSAIEYLLPYCQGQTSDRLSCQPKVTIVAFKVDSMSKF